MRKTLLTISTAAFLMLGTAAFAELKVGVINLEKVLVDSPQVEAAKNELKKKFDGREKELTDAQKKFQTNIEAFNKNSPTMKADAQKKEQQKIIDEQKKLQDMQTKFQSDLGTAQNDKMRDILKKIEDIVSKTAADKKLDLVVTKASVAFNKPELEITDDIVKQMNGKDDKPKPKPAKK